MVESVTITNTGTHEADVANAAHEEKMIAAVDAASVAPEKTHPELPEKFTNVPDLVKSYNELEQKLSELTKGKSEGTTEESPKPDVDPNATPTPEKPEEALAEKGLDFNHFAQEITEKGELSNESYEKLQKAGFPKEMVDGYIAGQIAIAEKTVATIQATIGGEAQYTQMIEWAAKNLPVAERVAFDKAVTTSDVEAAKLAVMGLHAKYINAVGSAPNLINGGTNNPSADVYESNVQVTKDMASAEYKTDPAFRAKVTAKIARSPKVL